MNTTPPALNKDYANPLAQCEFALATHLRKDPRLASEQVPVFANTQENAAALLTRAISQNLGHCVTVTISELTEITHAQHTTLEGITYRALATANIAVAVVCSGIIASSKVSATTDLGYSVLKSLDGTRFSAPFLTALEFTGWEQAETATGVFSSTLSFTAWIGLLEINT